MGSQELRRTVVIGQLEACRSQSRPYEKIPRHERFAARDF
jgi:hypothetical protein